MKTLIIILVSLLLLVSCSSTSSFNNDSSDEQIDISDNAFDVSSNDITEGNNNDYFVNTIDIEDLKSKYNNISINNDSIDEYIYTNDLLNIKFIFNINEYKPLSKQEIIDKYQHARDYFDEKHISKLLNDGYSYCDLILEKIDKNIIISLSISKPGLITYKDILSQYPNDVIEELIKKFEGKGHKNVNISTKTIDLFNKYDNKTVLLSMSYIDENDISVYNNILFIISKEFLGTLNIFSIGEDRLNEVLMLLNEIEDNNQNNEP